LKRKTAAHVLREKQQHKFEEKNSSTRLKRKTAAHV